MPLIKTETATPAEIKAAQIAAIIKSNAQISAQSLQRQITEFTQLITAVWKPSTGLFQTQLDSSITSADILAAYGTDAVAAFTASSNAAEYLLKQCDLIHEKEVADKLKARIYAVLALVKPNTKHIDGTITIG
jgi:hypothetical protein